MVDKYNTFINSDDVRILNQELKVFKSTEVTSDAFATAVENLYKNYQNLPKYNNITFILRTTPENKDFLEWFEERINTHLNKGYSFDRFSKDITSFKDNTKFYQKLFNPLHRGEIKKSIIDLRDNRGGLVLDFKNFVERFVTKILYMPIKELKKAPVDSITHHGFLLKQRNMHLEYLQIFP